MEERDRKGRFLKGRIGHKTHGHAGQQRSKEYKAWLSMRSRCYIPSATGYSRYGGAGIKVCDRWKNNFSAFLLDMGRSPSPSHSLDRINCKGNYEPKNCRWADWNTQRNNTNRSVRVHLRDRSFTIKEVCERYGMDRDILRSYIQRQKTKGVLATYTEAFYFACIKLKVQP